MDLIIDIMEEGGNYTIIEDIFDLQNPQHRNAAGRVRQTPPLPEAFRNHQPPPPMYPPPQNHPQHHPQQLLAQTTPLSALPSSGGNNNEHYMFQHQIHCIDAYTHMEECALCSSYFKKDVKFYWLIIAILLLLVILLASKMYDVKR